MVYVLDINSVPLMPTERNGKVKRMLKDGRAVVVDYQPFTIQLTYEPKTKVTQETTLGIDIGYTDVGASVITKTKELFSGNFKVRTDIQKRLADRRMYRRTRRGRKTRYRQPRFLNRKKKYGDAPSIRHKVDSHIRIINKITSILPVDNLNIEIANFDLAKINNEKIKGKEYQNGVQKGYENVKAYVLARDKHTCYFNSSKCVEKLEVHHLVFRSQGGSDKPSNLITLCKKCHTKLHDGKLDLPKNLKHKSLRSASFMNTVSKRLQELLPDIKYTYGYETKEKRYAQGLEKTHATDAFCIAAGTNQARIKTVDFQFKRKNNRQLGKLRKGFAPSSRKQRYPIQPKDIIEYDGKKYAAIGTHNKGTRVIFWLDGKKKSVSIKKVKIIFHQRTMFANVA